MTIKLTKHDSAWTGDNPRRVFQYDVHGYPANEGAGIAQFPHENWSILRWNANRQTDWWGDFATPDEALVTLQEHYLLGDSAFVGKKTIDGSLQVAWMNFDRPSETPEYALHFVPGQDCKDGPQKARTWSGRMR